MKGENNNSSRPWYTLWTLNKKFKNLVALNLIVASAGEMKIRKLYSWFHEMSQALSLLLILYFAYFISNLNLAASTQIYPASAVQPVLMMIPDFTFCSVYTNLHPMEVVKLFAWFPINVTRAKRCFLRCLVRKWGLFRDEIGRKWDVQTVSKYLFSIGYRWKRKIEAKSALYLCCRRHANMTTKFGCKNAFNFFFCLYNHGMSFLLTEKDISDYRLLYEGAHVYPERPSTKSEDETQEPSTGREVVLLGEDYDEPTLPQLLKSPPNIVPTLTSLSGSNNIRVTILKEYPKNYYGPIEKGIKEKGIHQTDVGDTISRSGFYGSTTVEPSIIRKRLKNHNHIAHKNVTRSEIVIGWNGSISTNSPSNLTMDVTSNRSIAIEKMTSEESEYATISRRSTSVSRFGGKTHDGTNEGFDSKNGETAPVTSEKAKFWFTGSTASDNSLIDQGNTSKLYSFATANSTRFNKTEDLPFGRNEFTPSLIRTHIRKTNSSNNLALKSDLVASENSSLNASSNFSSFGTPESNLTTTGKYKRDMLSKSRALMIGDRIPSNISMSLNGRSGKRQNVTVDLISFETQTIKRPISGLYPLSISNAKKKY